MQMLLLLSVIHRFNQLYEKKRVAKLIMFVYIGMRWVGLFEM